MSVILSAMLLSAAAAPDTRVFELRVYWAADGKLDDLHARFRDHTMKLFEKHGMENIGYWVPIDNPDRRLVYLLAHKSKEAAAASWKGFVGDADWQKAYKASEANGRLAQKVYSVYLSATDYSPPVKAVKGDGDRVFELRTYVCSPNNLAGINARFRDHTMKLFEKHGMTNLPYFNLAAGEKSNWKKLLDAVCPAGQEKADVDGNSEAAPTALVYLLSHRTAEARDQSFDAFRKDPVWVEARDASEKKAGGSLTAKDGVKSLMMKATDYSPTK